MGDFWRNFRWPNISINKYLFRFIIGIFIFVFLISQLSSRQLIFSKLLKHPELRHFGRVVKSGESDQQFKLTAVVVNRGFGPAHNVLVHVSVPDGKITNFKVDSQELYSLMDSDLQSGQLDIWLDRLASNAKIEIFLTGTFSEVASGTISISAASDEGSSIIYDAPTFTDELSEYVWQTYDLFIRTVNYAASLDEVQSIIECLHNQPIYKAMTSKVLTDVVLTGLLIIFFFWTYARRKSSTALVAGIVVGLLTWLIADFEVPAPWVLAPLLLVGYYKYILPFVIAPPTELIDITQTVWIIIWVFVIPVAAIIAIACSALGDTRITGSILVGLIVWLLWRSV